MPSIARVYIEYFCFPYTGNCFDVREIFLLGFELKLESSTLWKSENQFVLLVEKFVINFLRVEVYYI